MNFIHDAAKIRLSKLGYLPNYPYHLISDEELFDAFISSDPSKQTYFSDYYPCLAESLQEAYENLVKGILYHIDSYKKEKGGRIPLPIWIYSYMLGSAIGVESDKLDIHDLIYPLGVDNIEDEFNERAEIACYNISKRWIESVGRSIVKLPDGTEIDTRPPTLFGEPHVVKYIRVNIIQRLN